METIVYIRNICAHGGVLFDLKLPKGIEVIPMIAFTNNNRHCLDSSIKVILYFLSVISKERKNELEANIGNLFQKFEHNVTITYTIEKEIGFKKQ